MELAAVPIWSRFLGALRERGVLSPRRLSSLAERFEQLPQAARERLLAQLTSGDRVERQKAAIELQQLIDRPES
jgi:hypothetical protein